MRSHLLLAAALLVSATASFAASDQYLVLDHSSEALIDNAGAMAIWQAQANDNQRERLQKLYPVSKWGFVSQVVGGFTAEKACVVTARALMVPRLVGSRLLFRPRKTATAFATQAGATNEQCRELAAAKLKEAIVAVRSSLIVP
jgi:hypothetical protein